MAITAFAFHRPESLTEACALGRRLGANAAFLAGGTELLPDYQRGRETALELIALDRIAELHGIAMEDGALRIGALTSMAEIARSPLVRTHAPIIAEAARAVGSAQIRSLATIGGNFCRAVPCADTPPAAIVSDSRVRLMGEGGTRDMKAEQFFTGARQTALVEGEVLTDILVAAQPRDSGASYQRFARRRGSALAVAAVAARVTMAGRVIADARIALGAVGPVPIVAARAMAVLKGRAPSAELFEKAATICVEEALPISDLRGSAEFRRELVRVLARRALTEATARALGAVA